MPDSEKLRILVVEDETSIREGLTDVFVYHGYEVDTAADGNIALNKVLEHNYHLVILDIMLPGIDGFTVCERMRTSHPNLPIVMLTARDTDEDIIMGLSLGADDYVPKPFSVRELVLRVQAILRRTYKDENLESIKIGQLEIDNANLKGVTSGSEKSISFTRREISILTYLLQHGNRPVSRAELLEKVWGYEKASNIETRTVDIHIAKLRRKIELDPKNPRFLVTVRGEGYRLHPDGDS